MMSSVGKIAWFLLVLILMTGCDDRQQQRPPTEDKREVEGVIIAMGDSLTAGLGVDPEQSYPAVLEKELRGKGLNYQVINAGVSGETSSGARARVGWIIDRSPDLVIVETGANDGLRGLTPDLLRGNLSVIVETFIASRIRVVLVGMKMATNLGAEYTRQFDAVYPEVAAHHQLTFMPFFLEGVAGQKQYNQPDGIHPNEEGYRIVVAHLLPYVEQALAGGGAPRQTTVTSLP